MNNTNIIYGLILAIILYLVFTSLKPTNTNNYITPDRPHRRHHRSNEWNRNRPLGPGGIQPEYPTPYPVPTPPSPALPPSPPSPSPPSPSPKQHRLGPGGTQHLLGPGGMERMLMM